MIKVVFIVLLTLQFSVSFSQSIKFEGVPDGSPLKRNKEYGIYWEGNLTAQVVSIQLRSHDVVVHECPGFLKSGKYQVKLPGNLKLGDYSLVVVDPSSKAILQTDTIKVKRRVPLVAPIAVVFGLAFLFVVFPA